MRHFLAKNAKALVDERRAAPPDRCRWFLFSCSVEGVEEVKEGF